MHVIPYRARMRHPSRMLRQRCGRHSGASVREVGEWLWTRAGAERRVGKGRESWWATRTRKHNEAERGMSEIEVVRALAGRRSARRDGEMRSEEYKRRLGELNMQSSIACFSSSRAGGRVQLLVRPMLTESESDSAATRRRPPAATRRSAPPMTRALGNSGGLRYRSTSTTIIRCRRSLRLTSTCSRLAPLQPFSALQLAK